MNKPVHSAAIPFPVACLGIATFAILFVMTHQRWPAASVIRLHVLRGVVTSLMATLVGTTLILTGCIVAARQQPDHVDHVETTAV